MKITSLFTAMAMATTATVSSMPVSEGRDASVIDPRFATSGVDDDSMLSKRASYCRPQSSTSATTTSSPSVADCQQLARSLSQAQSWDLSGGNTELVSSGSCRFFAGPQGAGGSGARMGNEDVRDLILDSINKFAEDGRIGAQGVADCPGSLTIVRLARWHIR